MTLTISVFAYQPLKNVTLSDIEKRKKEVEEKLQILNARKHNLVQVLKQVSILYIFLSYLITSP